MAPIDLDISLQLDSSLSFKIELFSMCLNFDFRREFVSTDIDPKRGARHPRQVSTENLSKIAVIPSFRSGG